MVEKIAIVGNGLDLHHGIQSGYSDFYGSDYLPKLLKDSYDSLRREYEIPENWFDFEEQYRCLVLQELNVANEKDYDNGMGLSEANKKILLPHLDLINEVFQNINNHFIRYIKDEYERAKENEKFVIDKVVNAELKNADTILNFNYTKTLSDLYGVSPEKEIYVHGNMTEGTILGHSVPCEYEDAAQREENYGFRRYIPDMRATAYCGDKHLQRIERWNQNKFINGVFSRQLPYTTESGAFTINIKTIENQSFMSMNMIDKTHANPFTTFYDEVRGVKYINKLEMNFSSEVEIVIIGHGLGSDRDLLSKIPSKKKAITIFQRPSNRDEATLQRAKKIFGFEDLIEKNYSWD